MLDLRGSSPRSGGTASIEILRLRCAPLRTTMHEFGLRLTCRRPAANTNATRAISLWWRFLSQNGAERLERYRLFQFIRSPRVVVELLTGAL